MTTVSVFNNRVKIDLTLSKILELGVALLEVEEEECLEAAKLHYFQDVEVDFHRAHLDLRSFFLFS
jgi:hypothetical protein